MCWCKEYSADLVIAKEDVVVFKIFVILPDGSISSPIRGYSYERNKLYESNLHIVNILRANDSREIGISEGIHSFSGLSKIIRSGKNSVRLGNASIYPQEEAIFKCIIPVGSLYAVNEDYEIVSSSIMVSDYVIDIDKLFIGETKLVKYCELIKFIKNENS